MSVLTGPKIQQILQRTRAFREAEQQAPLPMIDIIPFDFGRVGPNSYDLSLAPEMRVYVLEGVRKIHPELFWHPTGWTIEDELDTAVECPTIAFKIPTNGFVLRPGILYLGSTVERTETAGLRPSIDGRSSAGRAGLSVHVTAGRGDDGFGAGTDGPCAWTLEITAVAHPVKVYPGTRIAQISYDFLDGDRKPYGGRYATQQGPQATRLWQDFPKRGGE